MQNITNPSGKGSRKEIEIELYFPSHTDSFSIILALSNHVMILLTSFWGKGKQKQAVKFHFWKQQDSGRAFDALCSLAGRDVPNGSDSAQLESFMSHTWSAQ